MRYPQDSGGLDDIGNATALGAALLAVHGATPVFASSLGVRLAEAAGDRFYPFPGFQAGDRVSFQSHTESLFVSDAGSGVARLLVCDQGDPVLQPGGRLLRVIPVPIDRKENWLDVTFTLDHHLVLRVEASGRMARARNADGSLLSPAWVQQLNLGFPIPSLGGGRP